MRVPALNFYEPRNCRRLKLSQRDQPTTDGPLTLMSRTSCTRRPEGGGMVFSEHGRLPLSGRCSGRCPARSLRQPIEQAIGCDHKTTAMSDLDSARCTAERHPLTRSPLRSCCVIQSQGRPTDSTSVWLTGLWLARLPRCCRSSALSAHVTGYQST
jgi:hypothetical protein